MRKVRTWQMKRLLRKEGWKKLSKQDSCGKKYVTYKRDDNFCEICYDRKRLIAYQVTTTSGELRGYRNFISGASYYAKEVKDKVDKKEKDHE